MEKLYQVVPLYKQSLLQRMFKQVPEENAVIEVNNLLATKTVRAITKKEILSILEKYRSKNLFRTFKRNAYEFYAVYLKFCLKDNLISDEELFELKHLKELLSLEDDDVEIIHNKMAGSIYRKSVQEAVSDGRLDVKEKELLERLKLQLRLPEIIANEISDEIRAKFVDDYLKDIVANERLSPEDDREFQAITKSLMIDVKMDRATKGRLEKFKLYWLIENGELTSLDVDIHLQKGEKCYRVIEVNWYEQRTVTKRINYSGSTARIKIMKGVYYRIGSVSREKVTKEEWKLIDKGRVYLTNKRIIFAGSKKNTNIRLDKILSFTPYSDGIEISKESGRSPLLGFQDNVDVFEVLLSRLLKDL